MRLRAELPIPGFPRLRVNHPWRLNNRYTADFDGADPTPTLAASSTRRLGPHEELRRLASTNHTSNSAGVG